MIDKDDLVKGTKARPSLSKWWILGSLGISTTIAIVLTKNFELFQPLENAIAQSENQYQRWGASQPLTNPWLLMPFAFGGGLLASISPCIL
ncbi:MAG: cytochrome c biogenesis protein CcdA, partial [Chamaesiphon sp.]|nr:cytochrome c biogenesis protein CcdA [Chamaesiphon sp.]